MVDAATTDFHMQLDEFVHFRYLFGRITHTHRLVYPLTVRYLSIRCIAENAIHCTNGMAMQYNKFISALVVSHFSVSHTRNHSCRLFPLSSFAHHNRNSEKCFFFNSLACVSSIISFLIWRFILIFQHVFLYSSASLYNFSF